MATTEKGISLRDSQQQEQQHIHYNRFEKYLLDNFDTDTKEVKQLELLLCVPVPLVTFMLLDICFHFIG